jgi:5-methylcytosine-specific restriction endonuclease McrA
MDEGVPSTQKRLETLAIRVSDRHRVVAGEIGVLVDELVTLVRELDPIRRQTLWSAELVRFIAQRQDWICPACGKEIPSLHERAHHVDHVVPWSLAGGNEPSNLQILHVSCNLSKGQRCELGVLIRYLHGRLMNLR